LVIGFIGGVLFWGGLHTSLNASSKMEFCISCHEMADNAYAEYKDSPHYANASGVQATCSDCHIASAKTAAGWYYFITAKMLAVKDIYHHLLGTIDTPEKYEAHRWKMANAVWDRMKARDSRECRNCHDFASMDLTAQERSAERKHRKAWEEGQTCIDCHKGVAHREPEEPEEPEEAEKKEGA
jgi:cytochrome c-type protein NapC